MKWFADECFDNDIIRGLLRREPDFDVVRAQDVTEFAGRDDKTLLAWACKNRRVVLTHDLATMVPALQVLGPRASATVVLVPDSLPIGQIINDVLLLDQCSIKEDWKAGRNSPAARVAAGRAPLCAVHPGSGSRKRRISCGACAIPVPL